MDNKNKSIVYLKKSVFFIPVFAPVFVLSLNFASALNANFTNVTGSIERALSTISTTNLVNFTIGAESENITQVVFTITGSQNTDPDNFIIDSNGTTSLNSSFTNTSSTNWGMPGAGFTLILTFTNITRAGIIPNGTTKRLPHRNLVKVLKKIY